MGGKVGIESRLILTKHLCFTSMRSIFISLLIVLVMESAQFRLTILATRLTYTTILVFPGEIIFGVPLLPTCCAGFLHTHHPDHGIWIKTPHNQLFSTINSLLEGFIVFCYTDNDIIIVWAYSHVNGTAGQMIQSFYYNR